jgi:predicted dehydrogenase
MVGCGLIAEVGHIPAILGHPDLELSALVDLDVERARSVARRIPGARIIVARELGELKGSVDLCVVATPNDSHATVVSDAVRQGLPCLVEKPLASHSAAAAALLADTNRHAVPVLVGYVQRFDFRIAFIRTLLAENRLNEIEKITIEYCTQGGWTPRSGYVLDVAAAGGGVFKVMGSHYVDRLMHWFGDLRIVKYLDNSLGGNESEAVLHAEVDGVRRIPVSVRVSKIHTGRRETTIQTAGGTYVLREYGEEEVLYHPDGTDDHVCVFRPNRAQPGNLFARQLSAFVDVVETGNSGTIAGCAESARVDSFVHDCYAHRLPLTQPWALPAGVC